MVDLLWQSEALPGVRELIQLLSLKGHWRVETILHTNEA